MSTGNRWTVVLGSGGELLAAHEGAATEDYDGLTPVEVVPCDDAAIERGMNALEASDKDYRYVTRADIRATVEAVLRAAGGTP